MTRVLVWVLALACLSPRVAAAQQIWETVGCRALGMAGAFVAVANDASAVYWNPSGMASGPAGSATIEWSRFRTGDQTLAPQAGSTDRSSRLTALGGWPIGLSYVAQTHQSLVPHGAGGVLTADSLRTSQYGLTVLQTVTQGVIVGATLKYVRGTVTSEAAAGGTTADALKHAAEVSGPTGSAFDVDLGVTIDAEYVRLGFTTRNLRSPAFKDVAGHALTLTRRSRVGLAVLVPAGLTLAMDLDLDTAALADGPRRMFAVGAEQNLGSFAAVRGGTRWSVVGDRRPVVAFGASVMVRKGAWIDAQMTRGGIAADRGFGIALRGAF